MGVIYLISVLALLITFILVKKTEKEINIISFLSISIVALFCYNTFICYILTFFTIPITLLILTLINAVIILILGIKIFRNKCIQEYTFNNIDILYIVLIAVIVLIVTYINSGFPFNIKYQTGDPSVHYLTSVMFAESDSLLAGEEGDYVYGSFNVRKTVSYVNSGLLMKCLCPGLDAVECYNVFLIFGMLTLFLTGVTMYGALTNLAKKKEHRLWAFIVSLICMLGYPLNSFLFGFEYLSMGLLIICAIIDMVHYYEKEILDIKLFVPLMALLNFGLFAAYYMFVPFMYPALWLYFCIHNYFNTKKIVTTKLIIILLITLLIPFILGYIYHLAPQIYSVFMTNGGVKDPLAYSEHIVNSGLATNGYIYINLYSNMLLLIPLTIYLFVKSAKNKTLKQDAFIGLAVVFAIAFIELLLIGNKFGKVSMYYLSKNYFALWILLLYCNYKALIQLSEQRNYIPRILIGFYVILMIIYTTFTNVKMINALNNPYENVFSVMEIFGVNKDILKNKPTIYTKEELDVLMYAKENLDFNSEIEVVSDDYVWTYVLLRYINKEPTLEGKKWGESYLIGKYSMLPEKMNNVDYIIYIKQSNCYKYFEDVLFENAEIIYENEAGGILKYKK